MRLLFIIIDGLPTFRPDVAALWGRYLPTLGCRADIVARRAADASADAPLWPSGEALTARRGDFLNDIRRLLTAPRGRYDAIQVRDKSFAALPALAVARWRGLPFFYWMSFPYGPSLRQQGRAERRNPLRRVYLWWRGHVGDRLLHRLVLPHADQIFVQSDRMADDLAAAGIFRARLTAVPMGIDPDRFPAPLPRARLPQAPPGARIVGYLGECSRARRIDRLIEAVATARQREPALFLLLVGDALHADERAWLRGCIASAGLSAHCHVTGWLPPMEATRTIAAAELCLAWMPPHPILDSTSPTKLVEYLAMGRPVVANDHPEQTQVIAASGAGLVCAAEPAAYADAVVDLLHRPQDHARMAARGRAWVLAERSYPVIAERLAERYAELLRPAARADGR